ncbi:MAG: ABC transporter, ATP-binding protein, MsbA family [Parcubacteria group bacterium GW2011_GWC2_42_12]|nr:MAG: ABC transporter, ATP-binding protein, MsbA family [Parcubacteria group bacterium GW2011_GWC2_42_12]
MILPSKKFVNFSKIFYRAYWGYKKQIVALTLLGFLSSLLEGIGINVAIPIFSFISGTGNKASDPISRIIKKSFDFFQVNYSLKYLFIFVCGLLIFRVLILLLSNYIKIKIAAVYEEKTRGELFKLTAEANWQYLLKQKLGYLETILVTNVTHGGLLLQYISASLIIIVSLVIFLLVAINISWFITLITAVLGGLIFFVFKPFLYRIRALSREREKINRQIAHHINENILGMKTIKAMSASGKIIDKAKEYFRSLRELIIKTSFLSILTDALIQPIGLIFVFIVFAISYKTNTFNFAALAAIIYLVQRIFAYTQQLQSNVYSMTVSSSYISKMLEYKDEVIKNKELDNGVDSFKFNNFLEFKDVGFYYNNAKQILTKVNFIIKKGEMIGLIGPSGAGKTTIVDIILRLFNPTKGEILLDGNNINSININEWRKNIGYVSQDIFLKNDTIANNIKFYNDSISDREMKEAAKMANIYDFIQSCPDKFATVIGERGLLLSTGQRQRIVIARILARRPKILILDEATSALDNESEVQIQEVIENLKNKVTVLLIAHRLSTVMNCNKLLVLQDGEIKEQGSPKELLADENSYYYKVSNIRQ